jgi:hypothetical protein
VQHRRQTHRAHGREHRCSPPTTPPHDRDQGDIAMPTADARPPPSRPATPSSGSGRAWTDHDRCCTDAKGAVSD